MGDEDIPALVLDCGSGSCKAGFAGEYSPRVDFPSIIAYSTQDDGRKFYVGNEIQGNHDIFNFPIQRGKVTNWDDMEKILTFTINNKLEVRPEDRAILLMEMALNSKDNREKTTQIFFENFRSPAFFLAQNATMSLYSSGKVNGVILDCGDGVLSCVPIFDGSPCSNSTIKMDYAGRDLTQNLANSLAHEFFPGQIEIVRQIKENLCYVALDYERELNIPFSSLEKSYQLPDGRIISLDTQRFTCPEVLFQPQLFGLEFTPIYETLFNSINKCDPEYRKELYSNVFLAGGSTMFEGFSERLIKELNVITPSFVNFKVSSPAERRFSAWSGGSILASLSTFQQMWITRFEYDECGPNIVHRKCF